MYLAHSIVVETPPSEGPLPKRIVAICPCCGSPIEYGQTVTKNKQEADTVDYVPGDDAGTWPK